MKIKNEDYEIICDTREQDTLIQDTLIKNGIQATREKLNTGDYAIRYQKEYIPNILIERKAGLDELLLPKLHQSIYPPVPQYILPIHISTIPFLTKHYNNYHSNAK